MGRYSFLKSETRELVDKEVDIGARSIGADTEYGSAPNKFNKDKFGICYNCQHLKAAVTEYNKIYAKCYELEIYLNSLDPVIDCSEYKKRGSMTLWEMKDIATVIEVGRRKAGFIIEED